MQYQKKIGVGTKGENCYLGICSYAYVQTVVCKNFWKLSC